MNTLVGLACAVGVDMGFNAMHHHDEEITVTMVHVHADVTKHQHHEVAKKRHHDNKDDCCNDKVISFQHLDKCLKQNAKTGAAVPVFAAILSSYYGPDICKPVQIPSPKYIVRFFHPPPPDIRILIRSFQI